MDDALIIEKILASNKNEYALLMDKYYKELFKYIYNMTNNYETTEDLLQEVFIKVFNQLHKFNPDKASFRTWIYRISHHHTINFLKKKSNQLNLYTYEYDDSINQASEDVEEKTVKDEQINIIQKAMEKVLKPKHYEIMALHYFSDLSVKEISRTTGIPLKTVYKAIESSVKKIKKEVGEG
ncbi:RNA polymerase sigma factor [Mycoplasmatota bacterium]|nr:RNA polymerase sigma factor [Mycoplasmatota bacterium]